MPRDHHAEQERPVGQVHEQAVEIGRDHAVDDQHHDLPAAADPPRQQPGEHPDPRRDEHLERQPGPDPGCHQGGREKGGHPQHEAEPRAEDPAGQDQQEEDQLDPAGAGREPAQHGYHGTEHPEDGEHPRVETALAQLGEHHRDHHGQQRQEKERRVDALGRRHPHQQRPGQHHQPAQGGDPEDHHRATRERDRVHDAVAANAR